MSAMNRHPDLVGDRCLECDGTGTRIAILLDVDNVRISVDCPTCHGTGLINSPNACSICHGARNITVDFGGIKIAVGCDHCNSSGLEPNNEIS